VLQLQCILHHQNHLFCSIFFLSFNNQRHTKGLYKGERHTKGLSKENNIALQRKQLADSLDTMHFFIPFLFILCLSSPSYSLDIVKILAAHREFNIISSMLQASGVSNYVEDNLKIGNSFTLFLPVDQAFVDLPRSVALQSLASDKKTLLLQGHILTVFYPLYLLQASNIPVQATLATNFIGSSFLLNISSVSRTVYLHTGVVEAVITKTVFDGHRISIFGISKVLLPVEFYGKKPRAFHSHPPPPPSPPMADDEDDDTTMWLIMFVSLDIILAILVIYTFRLLF
jgi:uncharacterized surface protein with fasciclin (FAS1) repeats